MRSKEIIKFLLVFLLFLPGCKVQYIPVKETEYVTVRDSVYFRDTTVQWKVEKEVVKDYAGLLDTLALETGLAEAKAWVDTTKSALVGEIKNKEQTVNIPAQVKEKIVYRDSIVEKEIPVPVEVEKVVHPGYEWVLWVWGILALLAFALLAYWKIKK